MALPWFRFYHEWASDAKVQTLPFEHQRHFVMILCWHASGVLPTLTDDVIAASFRMTTDDLAEMKKVFRSRGFIEKGWTPKNWAKRQRASDDSKARVQAHRERKKQVKPDHVTVTEPLRNGDVTEFPLNLDDDDDIENKKDLSQSSSEAVTLQVRYSPVTGQGDESLSCLDSLVEEVENTWPGSQFPGLVYDLGRTFLPSSVVYGFRQAMGMAWKGNTMTVPRIRGLVEYAQKHGLKVDDEIPIGPKGMGPSRPTNGRPKTEKQVWRDEAAEKLARLKAKHGDIDEEAQA